MKKQKKTPLVRFILYLVVIILINMVSMSLFYRIDLTKNRTYTLSKASKNVVSELEEPLTIKAFFSKNLPQPYNNLKQELSDLLEEYALYGNKYFNYTINTIDQEKVPTNEKAAKIQEAAEGYSIYPIQIQKIEKDEVKLQTAYMGIVFIHGDTIETIPSLASERNLEYKITGTIKKISDKIGALLSLPEDIKVKLYFSSALFPMGKDLTAYPDKIEKIIDEINRENYGRLEFSYIDPDRESVQGIDKHDIVPLTVRTNEDPENGLTTAYAALVVEYKDESSTINLLNRNLFGYSITEPDDLAKPVQGIIEKLIGVNKAVGFLADHGTPPLDKNPYEQNPYASQALSTFNGLVSENYNLKPVTLSSGDIPEGLSSMIIVSPKQKFSEWELFQIDQFIMKGNSVAFFLDTHDEIMPQGGNQMYGQAPVYLPRDTGLNELLQHYGIGVEKSYIMDVNCYTQERRGADGSITEIPVYFIPEIPMDTINKKIPFMKSIKGLIFMNISPLSINDLQEDSVNAQLLFSSSSDSWEMKDKINLYNPMMITPAPEKERNSFPLAYILSGRFKSFFKNRAVPERPSPENGQKGEDVIIKSEEATDNIPLIQETENGRIFLLGTSTILTDSLLDPDGVSPNSMFVLNVLDYLNDREDFAVMRSKGQGYNPLKEIKPGTKTFIKTFNIAVLPVLVIITGIFVWLAWLSRKKKIELEFKKIGENK